jgi:hypothetical protein
VLGVAFQARTQRRAAALTNVYGHAPPGEAIAARNAYSGAMGDEALGPSN